MSIKLLEKEVVIFSSSEILREYELVLERDFGFSSEDITDFLNWVLSFVTLVKLTIKLKVVYNDPKDNIIVECALESSSQYIITYDKHLLSLKKYTTIEIIKPEDARSIL